MEYDTILRPFRTAARRRNMNRAIILRVKTTYFYTPESGGGKVFCRDPLYGLPDLIARKASSTWVGKQIKG